MGQRNERAREKAPTGGSDQEHSELGELDRLRDREREVVDRVQ
jgi:hypothetical protein